MSWENTHTDPLTAPPVETALSDWRLSRLATVRRRGETFEVWARETQYGDDEPPLRRVYATTDERKAEGVAEFLTFEPNARFGALQAPEPIIRS